MKTRTIVRCAVVLVLVLVSSIAGAQFPSPLSSRVAPDFEQGAFVVMQAGGQTSCRAATPREALDMHVRVPTRVFGESQEKTRTNASAGLNIILRGTAQLDANPQAKAAFERAADIWESRIATAITVYVDVDFGSTRFGEPWPNPNVIASASSASYLTNPGTYGAVRSLLLATGNNATETALYNALPAGSVPTDLGALDQVGASSMLLRALGAFNATADPSDPAPSIGFNSAFSYDFEPSNGISPGTKDFEGVVVHEIGHMLGFSSRVGTNELSPPPANAPAIFDLFRFRPGVTLGSFGTATRILTTGGTQVYFGNVPTLALSTGNPNGENGDAQQASHWKDDDLSGVRIGIMDPTLASGVRTELTAADLQAFGVLGWNIVTPNAGGPPAAPTNLTATATSSSVIRLNWSDNSSDETEFRVEQKNLGTGAFVDIGSVPANTTQVNITSLPASTTATFRVRARNGSGNSGYTNEASATTFSTGGGGCTPNATTVCLLSDRFRVSIAFINQFANPPQPGNFLGAKLVAGVQNPDVATFGISSAQAIEVVVRIQDTRPFGLNRFDVYYGGLTDLEYTVSVTDVTTGSTKTYRNAPGTVGGGVDRTTFTAVLGANDRLTSGGFDSFYVNELPGLSRKRAAVSLRDDGELQPAASVLRESAGGGGACSETEPNETVTVADALTLGEPCTGTATKGDAFQYAIEFTGGIPDGQVQDVFVFNTTGGAVNVTLTFTNASADLDVFLFRITGTSLTIVEGSTGSTTTETINEILAAGTYYVGVSAYEGGSPYTLTVTGPGGGSVPAAPTNLTATAISTTQIRLNWVDNANNETEYVVEQKVNNSFVALSPSASANTTQGTVGGLSPGQTATFRVKARNTGGDSGYSNEASATTFSTGGGCTPNATTICLLNDRFRVSIAFINQFANPPAPGNFLGSKLVAGVQNPDVATFGISSGQAIEVVVRIQDTRPFGLNRFDVYYGGLTDLEYTVSVTDVTTGATKTYRNPPGTVGGGVDRTTFTAN